ncbi:ATP-utilizing chromatin assembly and remodelling N-terminal-domain-containing protein [Ephemerocybe angulata]|uniref:ATP-utilizing chromatin assembly and remodelling N-terminal-domain-containing protein n=1 Tax=Ephemerocybe angulata TaxID=980116 RepID=A0A8H6IKK1_9AGAR|nr:ATP-utilizing chromatin assembly and remodelling N-terminal-domain-containing protein [Tulosesus angulatus]
MPTCRRKRVVLTEPTPELLKAVKQDPKRPVFYLHITGEIFETYESYAARMSFYRLRQFQCEVTGKSGLDYFQALDSERQEARTLHSRFPEPLKSAVLRAVQWQVVGRLDHLVEAVYDRFKDRYFKGEYVIVDLNGTKFQARIDRVYPPKFSNVEDRDTFKETSANSLDLENPHSIGGDLKISLHESLESDNPDRYFYWVKLLEIEKDKGHEKGKSTKASDKVDGKLVGSLVEVQSPMMSRDRLAFSKSILRRFIRDCVDRDAAVASPWTVKPIIAARYGVDSVMPEETRKGVEDIKKGEIDKRKKAWEDKEGPPTKKQKKLTAAQEEKGRFILVAAEKKERDARDKAEKQRLAKEEAERLAAEKKKKKPVRYPTEDLDVRLADKDKKAGTLRLQRPLANRAILPFNESPGAFESFLMAWNFLVVYGQPLHLSVFSLDEFEGAIRHSALDLPCPLLAEVHSTLVYNLRTVPFVRHSLLLSLLKSKEDREHENLDDDAPYGITMDTLTTAMADVGNNWERVPLRFSEGREGWEEAVVGCLKDHANLGNFPQIREILTKLLFAPEQDDDSDSEASHSRHPSPTSPVLKVTASPSERYYALSPEERISILSFMCNLAISSKAIHTHMESCEEQLTALRKEKIEVNRLKKQYIEEVNGLAGESKDEPALTNGAGEDVMMQDLSDTGRPQKVTRPKSLGHSKEREAARAKQASIKHAIAERRRLDEELGKLERRLEGIERDFRKLLGAVRVKPLGRDRFYNRIWWFDGMGSASLVGNGGQAQYGTGRIFIQGPSEFDLDLLGQREDENLEERRLEEEGEDGVLNPNEWGVYSEVEELDEFLAWLNPKGQRELALKNIITRWLPHITAGMKKRIMDLTSNAKNTDTRRSARTKVATVDLSREPYMLWTNRKAINAS